MSKAQVKGVINSLKGNRLKLKKVGDPLAKVAAIGLDKRIGFYGEELFLGT